MELQQIRNATILLSYGDQKLLVDPMFCDAGAMPAFKLYGPDRQRNPLVPLPPGSDGLFEQATGCLVTHEHPDHLDVPARRWLRDRELPVWAGSIDLDSLRADGLDVRPSSDLGPDIAVEEIAMQHGRGWLGWMMGPVTGFYLTHPDEPSLLLTGDAVLTDALRGVIERLQPDVVVAPAGSANFGVGSTVIFAPDELLELMQLCQGELVFNHLEALDHCPTTRSWIRERAEKLGVADRVYAPKDGEMLRFARDRQREARPSAAHSRSRKPGLQKKITVKLNGT